MPDNHYEVLGITPTADIDTIKRAYRDKIRIFHPDSLAGDLNRAKQAGDLKRQRELERQMATYQKKTQQINGAYKVLADASQRQAYDRARAPKPSSSASTAYSYSPPDRTGPFAQRRAEPFQAARKPSNEDRLSAQWLIGLGVGLFIVFASVFSVLTGALFTSTIAPAYSNSSVGSRELQATQNVINTQSADYTRIALQPTQIPRTTGENVVAGDVFYEAGNYEVAVELYTAALLADRTNPEWLVRRGKAYMGQFVQGNTRAAQLALTDFETALQADAAYAPAYLGRAELNYYVWQVAQVGDKASIQARIEDDLTRYIDLTQDASNTLVLQIQDGLE